jgi:hypothetical protein
VDNSRLTEKRSINHAIVKPELKYGAGDGHRGNSPFILEINVHAFGSRSFSGRGARWFQISDAASRSFGGRFNPQHEQYRETHSVCSDTDEMTVVVPI